MLNARQLMLLSVYTLLAICGCGGRADKTSNAREDSSLLTEPPEITAEATEGFVDLLFRIQDHEVRPDGSQRIISSGVYQGRRIGFELILSPKWATSRVDEIPIVMNRGEVTYRSLGAESDSFLHALDGLYATKSSPQSMAVETKFNAISLEGEPQKLIRGPVKVKCFYEKGGEDSYAEFFTNIDLANQRIEFREKDEGYRKSIVRAFTKK